MSGLRVAFIPTNVSGVMFYRVWQPYLALKKLFKRDKYTVTWYEKDIYEMHQWEGDLYDKERHAYLYNHLDAAVRWADVVVWMGLHTPKALDLFVHFKAKYGKPFVSEFDDFVFSIPKSNAAHASFRPGTDMVQIVLRQIKESDALVVSTPYLKQLYSPFNKNVHVVENTVNLSLWRKSSVPIRKKRQGVTIGWMGGGTHNEDHRIIYKAVLETLEKCPNVCFNYISGGPAPKEYLDHPRIKFRHEYRDIEAYPGWISKQGFDIGIAPLVDNEFNRGKSNLRWLEFSAMGIPTVAADVMHFKQTVKHGETGFLAGTHEEWVKCLTDLVNDPELREGIGRAARLEIETNWTPEVQARKYRAALEGIANAVSNTGNT